ncbi:hypothetical protein Tsubulata_040780 [Turnera subulata]|uniref:SBP-type domain-containing protein n=1 Tax=Turnera subulata TaxID=218843 RepID=A0A9Q0F707_9ROSI|nr:hypothetical protein Tsubulata_040780 [Turnera subulata]
MRSVSLMEWNGKPPLQWDWENLIMFNGIPSENPKKLRETEIDITGEQGTNSGSFNSSGNGSGGGSGASGSDFDLACLSKSSKSASISSSPIGEVKTSKLTSEASGAIPEDYFDFKDDFMRSKMISTPAVEASVGSAEPLLSLKLGKRSYFEDVCVGSNPKNSSSSVTPTPAVTPVKRSKGSSQNSQAPRCQVEGCDLDLSSAKDYHRKHRVCQSHSRCPKVIVNGLERRFCQQCSRFHSLSEFDEKKRSCRRRLSDHNARRRKPQSESVHLNPARLSPTLYDGRHEMNIVWNRPLISYRPNADVALEGSPSSKFTIVKEYLRKPENVGGIEGQLQFANNDVTTSMPMNQHDSSSLFPSKVKAEVLNQGIEEPIVSSTVENTPYLHRALSLLSSNSWSSCEPKSASLEQSVHTNHAGMPQPVPHIMSQGLPLSSAGYWRTEQQQTETQVQNCLSELHVDDSLDKELDRLGFSYQGLVMAFMKLAMISSDYGSCGYFKCLELLVIFASATSCNA